MFVIAAAVPFLLRAEEQEFDPDLVTPGVIGFIATFVIMAAVVLLILDMVRRIRRVNYRAEVRQMLEAERLDAELAASDEASAPGATTATSDTDRPAASDDDDAPPRG